MDFSVIASKIAKNYIDNNIDLNDSIAKYASEQSFGLEQTKRLVEEVNKSCYLQKFASTGEQIFDVAQIEMVKNKIGNFDKVEKTAGIKFTDSNYEFEKTASENQTATSEDYQKAIEHSRNLQGSHLSKIASLRKDILYKAPFIEKLANEEILDAVKDTPFVKLAEELNSNINEFNKQAKIQEKLMEKRAGLTSSIVSGTLGVGSKGIGLAAKTVASHPGKTLMGVGIVQSGIMGAKKSTPKITNFISNNPLMKEASIMENVGKILTSEAGAGALVLGALGLTVAAAKGAGGLTSRMMQERQLNESFNTITKANSDIRQIPNARAYFDVVARHSPSLALDPMVAPQLIRQFDTFGGVDLNTVGKLREIQDRGGNKNNSSSSMDTAASLLSGVSKIMPKGNE